MAGYPATRFCPRCGTHNDPAYSYCITCQQPLPPPAMVAATPDLVGAAYASPPAPNPSGFPPTAAPPGYATPAPGYASPYALPASGPAAYGSAYPGAGGYPGSPPTAYPGPYAPRMPGPPPRRSKAIYVVVALAVAVALVVSILLFAVILPSKPSGGPSSFSSANSASSSAANGQANGPWELLEAVGIATPSSYTPYDDQNETPAACQVSEPTVPTTPASAEASGEAAYWEFVYASEAGGLLGILVLNGAAHVWVSISWSTYDSCYGSEAPTWGDFSGELISGTPVDTSVVVSALSPQFSDFLDEYPGTATEFAILGGENGVGNESGLQWEVRACSEGMTPRGTLDQTVYYGSVAGLSGVRTESETETADC